MCVCVCMFVRDNLENGWMDFDKKNLFDHYGPRLRHRLYGHLKNEPEVTEKWSSPKGMASFDKISLGAVLTGNSKLM